MPPVELDDALKARIVEQTAASFGRVPIPQMERERDARQIALLHALRPADQTGSGEPS
jgi:ketoreductase RED1